MLTISAAGKSHEDINKLIEEAVAANSDEELKVLIDGPSQAASITELLEAHGYNDVVPEDDEGLLFLIAAKKAELPPEPQAEEPPSLPQPPKLQTVPNSAGVLISFKAGKYKPSFTQKFIFSLAEAQTRPDVIGLMNGAVSLACYDNPVCESLRKLESEGVRVLVSEACADRRGLTEALGAGSVAEMSEIIDAVMSCEKVVSL